MDYFQELNSINAADAERQSFQPGKIDGPGRDELDFKDWECNDCGDTWIDTSNRPCPTCSSNNITDITKDVIK